jgi:Rieske Fe-S protein
MAAMDEPDATKPVPKWREDFPISWESDHYVTRRELAKFLTLGSALLVAANAVIAFVGLTRKKRAMPAVRIASADSIPPDGSLLFRYPTDEDPCILLRTKERTLAAYSQVCTHLSCAVVHEPAKDRLFCPCHLGAFACIDGLPAGGPPTRRLPRILLDERADGVYAVGVEV